MAKTRQDQEGHHQMKWYKRGDGHGLAHSKAANNCPLVGCQYNPTCTGRLSAVYNIGTRVYQAEICPHSIIPLAVPEDRVPEPTRKALLCGMLEMLLGYV